MSTHGLAIFDHSVQTANEWLNEVNAHIGPDQQRAYHALRAVLHALRDRLTVEEAADLAAQLPLLIRGIYYEGWVPAKTPVKQRSKEEFLDSVGEKLTSGPPMNPAEITRAVFAVLKKRTDPGEIEDVAAMLPKDIRHLLEAA